MKPKPQHDEPVYIPASPEDLARAVLGTPPRKTHEWRYRDGPEVKQSDPDTATDAHPSKEP